MFATAGCFCPLSRSHTYHAVYMCACTMLKNLYSAVKHLLPTNCTTGDVRLAGSSTPNKGRVEICINTVWASVCSSNFHLEEANVVCGQLGYLRTGVFSEKINVFIQLLFHHHAGSVIRGSAYYGQGSGTVVSHFSCRGNENYLYNCSNYPRYGASCSHHQDIGIDCEGTVYVLLMPYTNDMYV